MRILVTDGMDKTAMAQLRQTSNVPVILLTAKGEDSDKVLSLTQSSSAPRPRSAPTTSTRPRAAS